MSDQPAPSLTGASRRLRVWPAVLVAGLFWAFQFALPRVEMAMFARFMSTLLSSAAFLLLFLVFWLSSGAVSWKVRLSAVGLLVVEAVLGCLLADRTFPPMGFLLTSVPYVLSAWIVLLVVLSRRGIPVKIAAVAGVLLLVFGLSDLIRSDGLDGRLRSSVSWRWASTPEQAFLASRTPADAAAGRSTHPWSPRAGDWPEFRGSRRDGVVRGVRIDTHWQESPPERLWKKSIGPAWSSLIVVDGFLVTQEQRGEAEAVVCYEAETGKELWSNSQAARFIEGLSGVGPRATPTYRDGRIYALGGTGIVSCIDAQGGKVIWSRALAGETSAPAPIWGYSASPLVVDGKVIVFAGGQGAQGVVALDQASGAPVWSRKGGKESYSSAHLVVVRGKPEILMQDNQRLAGLAPADGAVLWEIPGEAESAIPMLQPCPLDDGRLLVTRGAGLSLLELKEGSGADAVIPVWTSLRLKPSFSDVVVHDGYIYGLDDGVLTCVELKTGQRVWKKGRFYSGQLLLLADQGTLVILSERGELALVDARPQEPGEILRISAIEGKTWNHPVIAEEKLFVRNATEMACFRLKREASAR
jgi:outer membrane protein assembly factor BamB